MSREKRKEIISAIEAKCDSLGKFLNFYAKHVKNV